MAADDLRSLAVFAGRVAGLYPEKAGRFEGATELDEIAYWHARGAAAATTLQPQPKAARARITPARTRARQSHGLAAGHRRTTSTRAGPEDDPGEPPRPLWRHPRFGLVNNALAAFLEARS